MNKNTFLQKYHIDEKSFDSSSLIWEELEKIYDDYILQINSDDHELIAQAISNKLNKISEVHSTKYRLKDPEHLIEKIIRKRIEQPQNVIDLSNYQEKITDLVGVRVLHLFKEDWNGIHKYIESELKMIDQPIAYYRDGDSQDYLNYFSKNNCKTEKHKFGYRSVHYLVEASLSSKKCIIEIQVRTIFEEGWSEVDHKLKYPYVKDDDFLEKFLGILNRFAGGADEMCSFIKELQIHREVQNQTIADLKGQVDKLKIKKSEKEIIKSGIDGLNSLFIDTSGIFKLSEDYRKMVNSIDLNELQNITSSATESMKKIQNSNYASLINPLSDSIIVSNDEKNN